MGKLFVMAIPVLPDKKQEFNSFIRELQEKYARDFARSRQEFGLRERTFFQWELHTTLPRGPREPWALYLNKEIYGRKSTVCSIQKDYQRLQKPAVLLSRNKVCGGND